MKCVNSTKALDVLPKNAERTDYELQPDREQQTIEIPQQPQEEAEKTTETTKKDTEMNDSDENNEEKEQGDTEMSEQNAEKENKQEDKQENEQEEEEEEEEEEERGEQLSKESDTLVHNEQVTSISHWLFRRVYFLARRNTEPKDMTQKLSALRVFAACASFLETQTFISYLDPIVRFLYSLSVDNRVDKIRPLFELLQETRSFIEEKVGTVLFFEKFNAIRQATLKKKQIKLHKQKIEEVNDPAKAILKRKRKNFKVKESKKRKIDHFESAFNRESSIFVSKDVRDGAKK